MVSSSAQALSIPRWVRAVELRAREVSAGADTEGDWAMVGTGTAAMGAADTQVWGACGDVAEALRQHRSQQSQQKCLHICNLHHSALSLLFKSFTKYFKCPQQL